MGDILLGALIGSVVTTAVVKVWRWLERESWGLGL